MAISTSHLLLPFYQVTPPYSSLPPLPHAPKVLGTARFRRSEIVSKAASKRSFCVSCEARSQALPPASDFRWLAWMPGVSALEKWEVFTAQWRNERTIASHPSRKVHHIILSWMLLDFGINHEDFWMEVIGLLFPDVFFPTPTWAEKKELLDKGLSMLRHTQMFGRNLGFACYKWLDKITKIFPKWWDGLMMMYRGRNLKNPYNKHKERVHFMMILWHWSYRNALCGLWSML